MRCLDVSLDLACWKCLFEEMGLNMKMNVITAAKCKREHLSSEMKLNISVLMVCCFEQLMSSLPIFMNDSGLVFVLASKCQFQLSNINF